MTLFPGALGRGFPTTELAGCPVLKHGPRSPARARLCGCEACAGSESKRMSCAPRERRLSVRAGTRKAVNYAWGGRSQGKPWWRSEAVLTCKSIVAPGHRGERPIEPPSSWFPLKFPSGQRVRVSRVR